MLEEASMAGHSKWKQIKRKKAVTDAKRGALFTRLIREITIAAKSGGGDPGGNPRLRTAIDAAKAENMPADNIDRAVKKGTGELEGVQFQEVTYEGYGPGGAAILIEATTDNPNRTVAEIRHQFSRNGGNLGAANSVAWMFDRRGQILLDATKVDEDTAMEAALDAGADDFQRDGDAFVVTTPAVRFHAVHAALAGKRLPIQTAELALLPNSTVKVEGPDAKKLLNLMEALEELDDVAKVSSNFDIDAEAMAEVGG
jgi:YebC/PmpR family DNA-binding regulatory protein